MTQVETARKTEQNKEIRFSIRGASQGLQVHAIETFPIEPTSWWAEFDINQQDMEYMNNPRFHIEQSREKNYIPFSNFYFTYDKKQGIIVPNTEQGGPLRLHYLSNKWHYGENENKSIYLKAQKEILVATIEGRRSNRIAFLGMTGGFREYQKLVKKFSNKGYDLSSGNYFLGPETPKGYHPSGFNVGYVDEIGLRLGNNLPVSDALTLSNWFLELEDYSKKTDPQSYIVNETVTL